jgi:predicted Rossmann fold nucleotide-binding protein DprA/Smf involved in DNA uptake|tara:strand:+ start:109 stop:510 length:402 start_codon:yes stop_codon:yes gene_type:complete
MKVAIIGSRMYENTRKMKDTLFQLKRKFGDKLIIISGGAKDGADKFARKYALEFGIKYKEFNPAHTIKNLYSAMSETYYEKPYHVSQFHHRNMLIARDCDVMIAFIAIGDDSNGSMSAIKQAKKLNKPVTIVS